MKKLLEVNDLTIAFHDRGQSEQVVKHVSFGMEAGEVLGIVGESGSGKTMMALTLMGLLKSHATIQSGEAFVNGQDFLKLNEAGQRALRGKEISMIFQEPMTALNPTMKIGKQVEEALKLHTNLNKEARRKEVYAALEEVELDEPHILCDKYPHELSGGMRQRVMIAAAIVTHPNLLIADEPTTALDVYNQEQIIKLLKKLNKNYHCGILFISHNLRVVKELCRRVIVMKDGEIVEEGLTETVFEHPKASYTVELIEAIPTRTKNNPYRERIMKKAGSIYGQ